MSVFCKKQLYLAIGLIFVNGCQAAESLAMGYYKQAKSLQEQGEKEQARDAYRRAIALDPDQYEILFDLATMLYQNGQVQEAIPHYERVVKIKPDCVSAHYNLGACFQRVKAFDRAKEQFETVLSYNPTSERALFQLGSLHHDKKEYAKAQDYFERALKLKPLQVDVWYHLGNTLRESVQLEKAADTYFRALEISPNHVGCLVQLGNTLNMLDKTEEALVFYKRALALHPEMVSALYNYAYTLKKLNRLEEALPIYNKIAELKPEYAMARFGRALSWLLLGDWERGWQEHEWRWAAYDDVAPVFEGKSVWDGQADLHGKTMLLYAEQGLGDTFQFIRYAQVIKQRGARVVAAVQKPLTKILSLCPYIDEVVVRGERLPRFDYYAPMMSLPLLCKTRMDSVPHDIPYLFADEKLVEYWRQKLADDTNFRIGICWQGNASYSTESLRRTVAAKSMKVSVFEPLLMLEGVTVYNLQKGFGEEQIKAGDVASRIRSFDKDFDEAHGRFMDTAAIIKNLDLVITIDTSTAHISAALGCPVWTMLPNPADWRWMLNRTDTPWYPNMKLFRQQQAGNWQEVMQRIVEEVKPLVARKHGQATQEGALRALSVQQIAQQVAPATSVASHPSNNQQMIPAVATSDWLDRMVLLALNVERNTDPAYAQQVRHELSALYERYEALVQQVPECESFVQELRDLNEQLLRLDVQLCQKGQSVFKPEAVELAHKIVQIVALKNALKGKIVQTIK